jgi:Na+/proline symporter
LGGSISIGFTRFPPANQLELESPRKEKEEYMISLVIGLFIGAFIGFFLAAIIARGRSAESITPQPQTPLTKVTHP